MKLPTLNGARRLPAVALLAMSSCFTIGPCGPSEPLCPSTCVSYRATSVATSSANFTDACPGASCPAVAERGSIGFAPSFHPAESALQIERASIASVRVDRLLAGDGASVSANVRCEPGGQLRFLGDDLSRLVDAVATEWNWTGYSLLIRSPVAGFYPDRIPFAPLDHTHVRFENVGSAPCFVARLEYETLANVCSRRVCVEEDVSEWDASATTDVLADSGGDAVDVRDSGSDVIGDAADVVGDHADDVVGDGTDVAGDSADVVGTDATVEDGDDGAMIDGG